MDPDEALKVALHAARCLEKSIEGNMDEVDDVQAFKDDAAALLESFKALNDWLSKGGFLPAAWSKGRK